MAKLFANNGDPDQTPHFACYPFKGLQTTMGEYQQMIYFLFWNSYGDNLNELPNRVVKKN